MKDDGFEWKENISYKSNDGCEILHTVVIRSPEFKFLAKIDLDFSQIIFFDYNSLLGFIWGLQSKFRKLPYIEEFALLLDYLIAKK